MGEVVREGMAWLTQQDLEAIVTYLLSGKDH